MSETIEKETIIEEHELPDTVSEIDLAVAERLLAYFLVRRWSARGQKKNNPQKKSKRARSREVANG